ncbi:MAG: hypothetical protein ACFFCH_01900 [Promethearchaeota archaeon]
MEEAEQGKQILWTPTITIITILMAVLLVVTAYYSFVLNLSWCLGLGIIYGVTLAFSYYYDYQRKRAFSILYVVQVAVLFVIIMVFLWFQALLGPYPFYSDYLALAFSMLFAGGMFGIPVYRYSKIKPKLVEEPES